jgi:hypothetical protein
MNVQKEAFRDASEYARAQVFYGEGAGNRRKLIKTAVRAKAVQSPAYRQAFDVALSQQNMAEHVSKARRERRRRDVYHAVNKNTRNAVAGRYTGMNTVVLVAIGGAYYAHRTGYDKIALEKVKTRTKKIRAQVEKRFFKPPTPQPPRPRPPAQSEQTKIRPV